MSVGFGPYNATVVRIVDGDTLVARGRMDLSFSVLAALCFASVRDVQTLMNTIVTWNTQRYTVIQTCNFMVSYQFLNKPCALGRIG